MSAQPVTLNLLAVQNIGLLRLIAARSARQITTLSGLAEAAGRDKSNVSKSLKALESAGLLKPEPLANGLTDQGQQQLDAIDRAEGAEPSFGLTEAGKAVAAEPGLSLAGPDPRFPDQVAQISVLLHSQILPNPENDRRDWDSDDARADLDNLRQDIIQNGLLQNLVVRPAPPETDAPRAPDGLPVFVIVGGERRWRAIGLAIDEDDWPVGRPILCRVLDIDPVAQRIATLSENLQRRDLNPIEKARGFEGLAAAGLSNQDIADRFGKTPEHIQQHRAFLRLSEGDQERMTLPKDDPRRLGVKEARQKLAAQAKADAPPPEVAVSPAARLALAEIVHVAQTRASYQYAAFEVGPAALKDIYLRELIEAGQVRPVELANYGDLMGRYTVWAAHSLTWAAFPGLITGDDDAMAAALAAEQALFCKTTGQPTWKTTPEAPYLTDWLNGPFEITSEGQALLDEAERQNAEQNARDAANIAEHQAATARAEAARVKARSLFVRAGGPVAATATPFVVEQIAQEAGARLPWRFSAQGNAVDADDDVVIHGSGSPESEARIRLMIISVNHAAGLDTPEDEAPAPGAVWTPDDQAEAEVEAQDEADA